MVGTVKAYKHFGITLKNERWGWSGQAPDGRVAVTIWKDLLKGKPLTCNMFGDPKLPQWKGRPGNLERIKHLKWARDHRNGLFHVVIATAVDVSADPRSAAEAYATKLVMKLIALDEETGEFSAEVTEMQDA